VVHNISGLILTPLKPLNHEKDLFQPGFNAVFFFALIQSKQEYQNIYGVYFIWLWLYRIRRCSHDFYNK
jgi:hypothetical protein